MPIVDTKKPRNVFTRMLNREAYAGESPGRPAKKWLLKKARQAKYRIIGTSKGPRGLQFEDPSDFQVFFIFFHSFQSKLG